MKKGIGYIVLVPEYGFGTLDQVKIGNISNEFLSLNPTALLNYIRENESVSIMGKGYLSKVMGVYQRVMPFREHGDMNRFLGILRNKKGAAKMELDLRRPFTPTRYLVHPELAQIVYSFYPDDQENLTDFLTDFAEKNGVELIDYEVMLREFNAAKPRFFRVPEKK